MDDPETWQEMQARLEAMCADGQTKWDLSPNDMWAIRWALGVVDRASILMRMLNEGSECPVCGTDEDHEPGAACAELYDVLGNVD